MSFVLDLAIAMIALFAALGLVVTSVNEAVASVLNARGTMLHRELRTLYGTLWSGAAARNRLGLGDDHRVPASLPTPDVVDAVLAEMGGLLTSDHLPAPIRERVNGGRAHLLRVHDLAMTRLSQAYQRRQRIASICVGTALATTLNIDLFALPDAIRADATLAAGLARAAEGPGDGAALERLAASARDTGFGWDRSFADRAPMERARLVISWAVMGLSASLGAPFWFDLLAKVRRVRTAA